MQQKDVVIGIDGGGTHTRVIAADIQGNILAHSIKGSASIYRDSSVQMNVQSAIEDVMNRGKIEAGRVAGLAAGIAGYDSPEDLEWITPLTAVPGLACPRWHVNDAVIAHYGAHLARPGIVAIAGTGSILIAINEEGRYLRNYDFHHYAASAARLLGYEAVFEVLAGRRDASDERLIARMLEHWKVTTVTELYNLASGGFDADRKARDRCFGRFAPAVTEEAALGSAASIRVCSSAIRQMKTGIELLGASFKQDNVPVAFIGSVAGSSYFQVRLREELMKPSNKQYRVVTPQLPPSAGAVLYALEQAGLPVTAEVIRRLQPSGLLLRQALEHEAPSDPAEL
ncbi:glucosamine kinase [Paenibacillus sp. PastM-3]|uniref:BadF/BadG/BcrA/BcrD ATPase family protein n=1 Tax=unclassified Paenibacillus TaxID=185978 RepID=UPI0024055CCB|nr:MULTISPECIES: BadF/BadG/BcrA/BcrD ATPase family protein [unclassified Paenibacillus]MDF9848631.1 glucosamine kinase [Paenibacillus sp. PastM-2]MDH6507898.1 glucosamine kinase [Paenibacillus sp. PastM-3]